MAMRKRSPIDRRFEVPVAQADASISQLATNAIMFVDAWGKPGQRFDLDQLGDLPVDLRDLLAVAFRGHCAAQTPATRRTTWLAVRRFARFVGADGMIREAGDIDTAAIDRYVLWLKEEGASRAPRGAHTVAFDVLRPLLMWCQRNRPDALAPDLDIPWNAFPSRRTCQEPRRRLPAEQVKAILRACYEEIDEAWARFQHGQEVIRRPELPPKTLRGQGLDRWIWRISKIEDGLMPDTAAMLEHGIKPATLVKHWGGSRTMVQYFHITTDTLVPFFLAIAIQTAANPDALRHIHRDCLVAHPLHEHRVIIDWTKARTGGRLQKAQRRSFDRRRRYAAPNLIEKMLALTAPIVATAPPGEQDRLFLTRSIYREHARRTVGSRTGIIDHSLLRRAILRFIERANGRIEAWNAAHPDKPREAIANFAPALFRGTVATEHYRASGGDVLVAQSLLNHASIATTETYLRSEETTRFQRQTIARLQEMMIAWVGGSDRTEHAPAIETARATAPFGHDCLAPLVSDSKGNTRVCPRFGGCLSCPGLVIPMDAEHLARVLAAVDRFEQARHRLDAHRWNRLYAPSWRILTQDILPDFPAELHEAARRIAASMPPLPELE